MNSTKDRAHASVLFDKVEAALEIAATENNVIEHRRHLIDEWRHVGLLSLACKQRSRNEQRTTNAYKKRAACSAIGHRALLKKLRGRRILCARLQPVQLRASGQDRLWSGGGR